MKPHDARKIFVNVAVFFISLIHYCLPVGAAISSARPIRNRPDGWNELCWHDSPEKLGPKKVLISDNTTIGAQYEIPGESAVLGAAKISNIKYYFKDNKLISIDFVCPDSLGNELLSHATEQFGSPNAVSADEKEYVWVDGVIIIHIIFGSSQQSQTSMRYILQEFAKGVNAPDFSLKPIPNKSILEDVFIITNKNDLELIPNMGVLKDDYHELKITTYKKKKGEIKYLAGFEIKSVYYIFSRSKLVCVSINFSDTVSSDALKTRLIELFGEPTYVSNDDLQCDWVDDNIDIDVFFRDDHKGGKLYFGKLLRKIAAIDKRSGKW
jgi:hypothetical protein